MKNNNYNLVVLHHEEVFQTREEAIQYLDGYYKPYSLDGEPVVVKYGETNKPNIILAFGTSDVAPGGYYAIDMTQTIEKIDEIGENIDGNNEEVNYVSEILDGVVRATGLTLDDNKINDKVTYEPDSRDEIIGEAITIAEALDLLSKYIQNGIRNNSFSVEDTNSVEMVCSEASNGEKVLKANVKVSTDGDTDDLTFNNNIIGIKPDGIYAASNLSYDDVRHQLIFTTSGYKNGRFQDDAIVQRVDLGEHVDVNGGQTDTLETLVNKIGNVATITGNVKLGSTNSIVVRNGGLEANISIDVDASSNKLIVTIGNQTITKQLPGVELFESAEYNDANEEIIITFRTGNTLVIPIHGLIHTWDAVNSDNSPIILTKTVVTGGVDKLSGNIKLRSTDNLIGLENGRMYVSEQGINNKVANETTRATEAENAIRTSVETLQNNLTAETSRATEAENTLTTDLRNVERNLQDEVTRAQTAEAANSSRIDELEEAVGAGSEQTLSEAEAYTDAQVLNEKTAREAKDVELADSIEELESEVNDMKFITNETNTVKMTMVKETGAETRVLSSDVKLKTISGNETANIIKSDANGLYATVTFNYDKAANEITFNDGNGEKVYQLNNFGILEDAIYDSQNKEIVLIVKKDDDTTERITIPVSDLVNTWSVENAADSPIVLTKAETENGDVLSADVSILNNDHNLLVNQNGSLFVDADCNKHIALWGNELTNVQGVINILKERTDDIEQMKEDIEELETDNENIKIAIAEYQTDLTNQKERITTNENNIVTLFDKTHNLEVQVAVLTEKVSVLEGKVDEVYDRATEALEKVETLIENIGDGTELLERIERIENVLEQLIDFGEYDIQL